MLNFLKQYIMHPRSVGALAPSGKELAKKMIEPIDFNKAKVIIEYGPGTGSFSRELINNKKEDTILILIEQNKKFYEILESEFKEVKNLYIFNDSAENADKILNKLGLKEADYIVSGLPFTSLPKTISLNILDTTKRLINEGCFITFQYSKIKKHFFENHFNFKETLRAWKNLPPAYVYVLENKNVY